MGEYEKIAKYLTAIGYELRIKIIIFLMDGPARSPEIAEAVKENQMNTYRSLKVLQKNNIIIASGNNKLITYSLSDKIPAEIIELAGEKFS